MINYKIKLFSFRLIPINLFDFIFKLILLSFFFLSVVFYNSAQAAEVRLSEKKILLRCYAQLTGERLPASSPLWAELNQTRAQNICMNLLNSVALGADGYLSQRENFVHRKVLRQFYDLHRSWFQTQWISGESAPDPYGTVDVIDPTEPSLHITKNLFSQAPTHYREVLRGTSHLKALRTPSASFNSIFGNGFVRPSASLLGPLEGYDTPQIYFYRDGVGLDFYGIGFDIIQLGELVGITNDQSPLMPDVWTNPQTSSATINEANIQRPAIVRNNFGGGPIGSSAYLLTTLGHSYDYRADGALKLPRKWTESVFKNFMCKNAPYVRESDTPSYLVNDPNAAPFRQATSCLRCHTTLDQAATTARHIRLGATLNVLGVVKRTTSLVLQYNSSLGENTSWPSTSTANFHLTTPTGKLYFRDRTGTLVNRNLSSIAEFGAALSENEDYYTCAAQRYFGYFTGIDLNLEFLTDPLNASSLTAADLEYRDYVIGLGKELQSTGSLKQLIENILQSGYYQHEQRKR